jgi:curli biogenesis system outer membrane secretion channel CsgG
MTAEETGDFTAAGAAYQQYIGLAKNAELQATARQRLALMGRRQLEYQARQALADEATLATMPPESNTVAVMPFSYGGTSEQVRPLGRGLAQLLVTDLAKSRQLRVLERERMQAILNELKLADSARVDSATVLRSGRLLRAVRVVEGTLADLPGEQLHVDALVVDVVTAAATGAPAAGTDQLNRLFDLEKQIAFTIFNNMGVQLSPAEQEAINQRPTQNIQAFLAYSRGLEAQDRGDYGAAEAAFNDAVTLDPSFRAASQGAASASELSTATQQTVSQVEQTVSRTETIQAPPAPTTEATQTALHNGTSSVNSTSTGQLNSGTQTTTQTLTQTTTPPPPNNNTAQGTGTLGPTPTTGTVVLVIKRPS